MVSGANFGQNFFSSGQFLGRGRNAGGENGPGRGQNPGNRGGPPGLRGSGPPGLGGGPTPGPSRAGLMQGLGGSLETRRGKGGKSGGSGSRNSGTGGSGRAVLQQGGQQQPLQGVQPLGGIQPIGLQQPGPGTPQGLQGGIPPINRTNPQQYLEALRALMTPTQLINQTVPQATAAGLVPQGPGQLPFIPPANPQGQPGGFTSIPANPFGAIDAWIGSGLGTINNILQLGGIQVPL